MRVDVSRQPPAIRSRTPGCIRCDKVTRALRAIGLRRRNYQAPFGPGVHPWQGHLPPFDHRVQAEPLGRLVLVEHRAIRQPAHITYLHFAARFGLGASAWLQLAVEHTFR